MSYPQHDTGQQWQAPQPAPAALQPRNGFGVAALVLGIVGAVFALIPIVGVIAWPMVIVGLVFGVLGILRARKGVATNKGVAISGTVLSGVGLAICIIWAAAFGATASQVDQDLQELDKQFQQDMEQLEKDLDQGMGGGVPSFDSEPVVVPTPEPEMPTATTIPGDGTFLVGTDIEPGTYRSAGGEGLTPCYWARLSSLTGELGSISNNHLAEGSTLVTIKASDKAFETRGCQDFELVE